MSFIRRKRVHKHVGQGERRSYWYYYRVENRRTDGKHQQIVLDYLGDAKSAIAKLEASEVDKQEKSKLRARLEQMIADEAGAHQNAQIA